MMTTAIHTPRLVVFADLDDTLFQTLHKRDVPGSIPIGYGRDDKPHSYACPKQQLLLKTLMAQGTVIPTTARNYESFKRIRYPFSSFAILNFGATVLNPGGDLNETWHADMCERAKKQEDALNDLSERAKTYNSKNELGLNIRLISDFGQAWYILIKHLGEGPGHLDALQLYIEQAIPPQFTLRRNGNNLTISPSFFDKKHAVQKLVQEFFNQDQDLFIGAGDSLSDFEFMSHCDFMLVPTQTQLHDAFSKAVP